MLTFLGVTSFLITDFFKTPHKITLIEPKLSRPNILLYTGLTLSERASNHVHN